MEGFLDIYTTPSFCSVQRRDRAIDGFFSFSGLGDGTLHCKSSTSTSVLGSVRDRSMMAFVSFGMRGCAVSATGFNREIDGYKALLKGFAYRDTACGDFDWDIRRELLCYYD